MQESRYRRATLEYNRLWGTYSHITKDPGKFRANAKIVEKHALDRVLPPLGFSEIYDATQQSSGFFVDFVATYQGKRVLVDVTSKWNAYVPQKIRMARALRMPFFVLFVSADLSKHFLVQVPDSSCSTVKLPISTLRQSRKVSCPNCGRFAFAKNGTVFCRFCQGTGHRNADADFADTDIAQSKHCIWTIPSVEVPTAK